MTANAASPVTKSIETRWVNQIFDIDPAAELRILCLDRVFGNIQPYELFALLTVVKACGAKTIFEIGTFNGRTTRNFAANVPAGGAVYTLDLQPDVEIEQMRFALDSQETPLVLREAVGSRYQGTPEQSRITQLFGDSGSFDFSPYHQTMDLVFVDGSHSLDYVRSDTENALKMAKPGSGVILWHDYGNEFPDVRQYLDDLAVGNDRFNFYHLLHTLMVVAVPQ